MMVDGMTVEDKNQLKLERLQTTLNRAFKNVPFHRNRFLERNILPEHITSLEDLAKLPMMNRTHLGTHYPYGLFAVPLRDIVRIHTAPGTTASPSISGYTKTDLILWKNLVNRSLVAAGVTDLDIIQIHLPPGLANWGRDYKDGGETLGSSVIPNSPLSLAKTLMVLKDYKTTTLITTPAFAEQLVDHMFDRGNNPNELTLKRIILVGEPIDEANISDLEQSLHVDAWNHYGLSEIPGPAIAFGCKTLGGLHINDDHILPEIIDPETEKPVPMGERGELVLTTLSARAFPLIRFRTGDTARFLTHACGCRSPLMGIQWFKERTDNMIIISGIKVSLDQVKKYLQKALGMENPGCTIDRLRKDGTETLVICLTMDDALFSDEIKELEKLIIETGTALAEQAGVPVKIRLVQ
ncbi:MAG: AMP-binding protein [Desulfobacterium sp.]|jgi:phenylacetate-CoA ligase|nr:AMP-binding protein [Desulfobacterium sp.]